MNQARAHFDGGLTVLMAVYQADDPDLFERALASVYANTLQPDEVLLVVDGPVPSSINGTIDRYVQERGLTVLRLATNGGLANALNKGLKRIQTVWVARADADDFNMPERFERQARAIAEGGSIDIVGGNILEVERNGTVLAERRVPPDHARIVRYARTRCPFNHMTVVYRHAMVMAVGGYPTLAKEDYGLWASLLAYGCRAANVPEILVEATAGREMYRRRGGLRYARAEFELQRFLVGKGLKSPLAAVAHGMSRAAVFVLPNRIRGLLYERLLRRRPHGE